MEKMTYNEARSRIIDAYFKDEIAPFNPSFCFCGTLAPNDDWRYQETHNKEPFPYTPDEYRRMERPLMDAVCIATTGMRWGSMVSGVLIPWSMETHPEWENGIFTGMCDALAVLKQIHIERGEKVDEGDEVFYQRTINDKRNAYTTVEG